MKRVGIVTLDGTSNYGNRLQNYALQQTLEQLGYEVDTLVPKFPETETLKEKIERWIKIVSQESVLSFIGKVRLQLFERKYPELRKKRNVVFDNFTERYIRFRKSGKAFDDMTTLCQWGEEYDYFVVGSDQVWRPAYIANNKYYMNFYFLQFADISKRAAYAASFGISELPEDMVTLYAPYIKDMVNISVREAAGQKILKESFQKDSELVIDPTMLLTKEQWLSIANEDCVKTKKYILVYFLGNIEKKLEQEIKTFANDNQLEIINLAKAKGNSAYISGPAEFISYIQHAQLVCTDSFHGTVFSILLHTPFLAFERSFSEMMSRIDTLLDTFSLQARKVRSIYDVNNVLECDFLETEHILEKERRKAVEFLKSVLV